MRLRFNFRPGMSVYSMAFLSGVVLLQQFSSLTPNILVASSFTIVFIGIYFLIESVSSQNHTSVKRIINVIMLLSLLNQAGVVYAFIKGDRAINSRFDDASVGVNFIIKGTVASSPVATGRSQRFEFTVSDFYESGEDKKLLKQRFPEKIRLSWYAGSALQVDEKWQLEVRLKPPHGFMNPGGFDYEKWLFLKGIHATGYVVKSTENELLQTAPSYSITGYRQAISSQIDLLKESSNYHTLSMVKALAIGEKALMSEHQWQVLTNTGTSHLMAISGLHIGLAALFASVLIRRCVPVGVTRYFPAQYVAVIAGVIMAFLYALVAGLSVPTQRALIMLIVISVFILLRRNHRPFDVLGFALLAVLLFDPVSVLSAGFWFSFAAVAAIFISFMHGQNNNSNIDTTSNSIKHKFIKVLKHWLHLQMVISIFLLPLSLFMFQQVSLVSPLVNLLLIPYVSFLVVPAVLLAILFSSLIPFVSNSLFILAAQTLDLIWPVLSTVSSQPFSLWHYDGIGVVELLIASFTLVVLYFSKALLEALSESKLILWLTRSFLLLVLSTCFIRFVDPSENKLKSGEIDLTVLDVGQGSSAVIQTQNHVLVFDAGAKFSNKLDTGKSIIIPFLRSKYIKTIDTLVISHGDADHIGGAQSLLDKYPEATLIGQDIDNLLSENKQRCHANLHWQWDGVDFKFLSPESDIIPIETTNKPSRNNYSCVLQIISDSGTILMTGDIEKSIEMKLLEKYGNSLASDVLIVPHHGSNTSSMMSFISAVKPKISIISAGYRNRYRLPNHQVISRYSHFYKGQKNRLFQTHSSGAIRITLKQEFEIKLQQFRESVRKYWHYQ